MSSYEEVPMKSNEDDEGAKKESGGAFVISRNLAIVLVVVVIALIIFVGVISGVFSARQARKEALEKSENSRRDDSGTTARPSVEPIEPTEPFTRPEPWYKIRLPQNILPIHYELYLDPYLEQNTFQGKVSILINVTEKSDYMSYILIHIKDMNVTGAKVYKPAKSNSATTGEEVALKDTFENRENDFFVFQLEDDLDVGQYVLVMSYKSTFSRQLNGLYISTYTNEKGEKR